MRKSRTTLVFATTVAALLGAVTACGSDDGEAPAETVAAASVTVTDAWVRAADADMTAVFGVLENHSDTAARLVAAESDLGAVELHEVVESGGAMVMQEVPEGFLVPADGERELAPGGDHLMLMGLSAPILAGDAVTVTLRFADDSELEFTAVAKDFGGGDEEYKPDMDDM